MHDQRLENKSKKLESASPAGDWESARLSRPDSDVVRPPFVKGRVENPAVRCHGHIVSNHLLAQHCIWGGFDVPVQNERHVH